MDVSLAAAALRRTGAGGDGRPDATRMALALRAVLPVVEASAVEGDLTRDLKSLLLQRSVVHLVLPADGGAAQLDTGLRRFVLPSGLRDALLQAVRADAAGAGTAPADATANPPASAATAPRAAPEPQLSLTARALAAGSGGATATATPPAASGAAAAANGPAFVAPPLMVATAAAPPLSAPALASAVRDIARQVARADAPPTVQWRGELAPLGEAGPDPTVLAVRLRSTVERSGLFFEAHLAQWAQGTRSAADLSDELRRMSGAARSADPVASAWTSPVPGGAERVAAQLELMQAQALQARGAAWPGQAVQLTIRRDGNGEGAAGGAARPVFVATLALELPHLGRVEVQLRLAGDVLALRATAADPRALQADLAGFAEQLAARGLRPAALQVVAATP